MWRPLASRLGRAAHLSDAELIASAPAALWPTPGQVLLLRSALLSGHEALDAWQEWKRHHDLVETDLDHGSFRLLPLVYRNLIACGADEPLLPRLKGIYRYWWCWNQPLFYRAASVIRRLDEAGIESLLLKGAAASVLYYRDLGVRPMADIDLLIPIGRASSAVAWLGLHGWRPARPRVADLMRYQHSVRLVNETGEALDLHWHALRECVLGVPAEGFWRRSLPLRVLDVETRGLGPSDALLHAIVHGMRWNEEPTMRWIPDAMVILRSANGDIDWAVIEREARLRHVLLRLRLGLAYLRHTLDAPIPEGALERLRDTPTRIERLELRVLALGADGRRFHAGHLLLLLVQYLRFLSGKSLRRRLIETPAYVRYRLHGRLKPVKVALGRVKWGLLKVLAGRERPVRGASLPQGGRAR